MNNEGPRVRVQRLLRKEHRHDDLPKLFLYIRDRCDGRESIREIGDFVAHQSDRTKGVLTQNFRDQFSILIFQMARLGRPVDMNNLPPEIFEIWKAVFRQIDSQTLLKNSGIKRALAEKVLVNLPRHFTSRNDGGFFLTQPLDQKQTKLVETLSSIFITKPAFDDGELFRDFSKSLKSNGLISQDEIKELGTKQHLITLFAISMMHNSTLILDSKKDLQAHLALSINHSIDAKLAVLAEAPVPRPAGGVLYFSLDAFSTKLGREYLAERLLEEPEPWNFEIEVTSGEKLDRLR